MKYLPFGKKVDNEEGFVLVTALLVLVVLSVMGNIATNTMTIEKQIAANDSTGKDDFYNQETCLGQARLFAYTWLTDAFINDDELLAAFPVAGDRNGNGILDAIDAQITDANGLVVATYEVRNTVPTGAPAIGGLSNFANDYPGLAHKDKPLPGSGYSQLDFEIRRFTVTCQSSDPNRSSALQEGLFKVFNKF